jgi:hypothetical protein
MVSLLTTVWGAGGVVPGSSKVLEGVGEVKSPVGRKIQAV